MGRRGQWFWRIWWSLLFMAIGMLLIGLLTDPCTCDGADFSVSYGHEVTWSGSFEERTIDHSSVEADLLVSDKFPFGLSSSLVLEHTHVSAHNVCVIDNVLVSGTYDAIAVSWRVRLPVVSSDTVKVSGFGGFGWLHRHLPEIERSGFVGHFGAEIVFVVTPSVGVRFAVSHMSDPFHDNDSGHERHYIGLLWKF